MKILAAASSKRLTRSEGPSEVASDRLQCFSVLPSVYLDMAADKFCGWVVMVRRLCRGNRGGDIKGDGDRIGIALPDAAYNGRAEELK